MADLKFVIDLDYSNAVAAMARVGEAADRAGDAMPDFRQRFAALVAVDRVPIHAEAPTSRQDGTTATLRLYDPIDSYGGTWGVSAKEMTAVLDGLPEDTTDIRLLINSPGGEVFEGVAILNALRAHKAKVTAVVEGIAASSASFIACGVDELVMAPNSELFVHNAWGLCVGDALEMQKMADDLNHISDNIASIYAAKAGGEVEQWRQTMAEDTWFSADEAVAAGLADRVDDSRKPEQANAAKARHDLSVFGRKPRAEGGLGPSAGQHLVGEAPEVFATSGTANGFSITFSGSTAPSTTSATPPSPTPTPGQKGGSMPDLTKLRDALGLAEDITDDQIVDWLAAEASATPPPTDPAPLPDGVVTIDAAALADLRANAQAGVEARAEQLRQHRAALVDAAVADGRIAPARRDGWLAQLEADPGAETVLAKLEKGLIPLDAKGTEAGDLDTEFAEYVAIYGKEA